MRRLTVVLCVVWAATLLYGEMFAFWLPSLWTCSWPHSSAISRAEHVKVAVLTDPQLMDRTSINLAPKSIALETAQFYTDIYMRRAFLGSVWPLKPDVILFLGDYFDGGPFLSDEEWEESLSRFRHIFDLNALEETSRIPIYYLSGNHDIGYAAVHSRMPKAALQLLHQAKSNESIKYCKVITRYENKFAPRNYKFTVGKVDFIAVDAQAIDGHMQGNFTSATWKFVQDVSKDINLDFNSNPRVLLSHIPLYRQDWTYCGPHRSSPVINQRVSRATDDQEITYQNYITEKAAHTLLDLIRPVLILSGHDHDQCTVTHMSKYGPIREHTLGTISWQQGNLYPSFMLLSASNLTSNNASSKEDAVAASLCFLPVQTFIYLWYLSQFVLTLLVVILWPTSGLRLDVMGYIKSLINSTIFRADSKEKNEDENCEYEMVWDADGSMHLIKKAVKAPTTCSNERVVVERGNAIMRSTAKKQITQEIDISMPLDVNIHVGLDVGKLATKASKSKARVVIQRLVRTFRVLSIVAAVNLPLYIMLLFKDWIDK